MKKLLLLFLFPYSLLFAQDSKLTIYNSGFALVEENITAELKPGKQVFTLENLSYKIFPNSIILNFSGNLYEYSFKMQPDISSILQNSIGKEITLFNKENNDKITGNLLLANISSSPKLVLKKKDNSYFFVQNLEDYDFELKELSENFFSYPKIDFLLEPHKSGKQNLQLKYLLDDIIWSAQHQLVMNDADNSAALSSNFQIVNNSLKEFTNVKIKLILGNVPKPNNLITQTEFDLTTTNVRALNSLKVLDVEQQELSDIFVYEFSDKLSLKHGEIKRIKYQEANKIKINKRKLAVTNIAFENYNNNIDVFNTIEIINKSDNGLGFVIPRGVFTVYSSNGDKLEFIGESPNQDIPVNDIGAIQLGKSLNLYGKSEILIKEYEPNGSITTCKYTFFNESNNSENVVFLIYLNDDIQIINCSHKYKFEKNNAIRLEFNTKAKQKEEITLTYRTRQNIR